MFKKLIPTDAKFFEMWGKGAKILLEGTKVLAAMESSAESIKEGASRLERLEHDADVLTHEILIKLDKSFITPIDREDIHQLTLALDDCMDFIEAATERMVLYNLAEITPAWKSLVEVLVKQAQEIDKVIPIIAEFKYDKVIPHLAEINRLENSADKVLRGVYAELFNGKMAPLDVMKWRDIYDNLETATDNCERVAGIIEGIVLKHG